MNLLRPLTAAICPLALCAGAGLSQTYDSGSDGSDGALTFEVNEGVVVFDPVELGLDDLPQSLGFDQGAIIQSFKQDREVFEGYKQRFVTGLENFPERL